MSVEQDIGQSIGMSITNSNKANANLSRGSGESIMLLMGGSETITPEQLTTVHTQLTSSTAFVLDATKYNPHAQTT